MTAPARGRVLAVNAGIAIVRGEHGETTVPAQPGWRAGDLVDDLAVVNAFDEGDYPGPATEVARRLAVPGFLDSVRRSSAALRAAALRAPVREVRGAGLLLGLVLEKGRSATEVQGGLLERGVLVGTSNDPYVLRLAPPLTIEPASAARLADALEAIALEAPKGVLQETHR